MQLLLLLAVPVLHGCGAMPGAGMERMTDGQPAAAAGRVPESGHAAAVARGSGFRVPAKWQYSAPLISPERRDKEQSVSQKDPSIVYHDGRWHVFMTVRSSDAMRIEYVSFERWEEADRAPRSVLQLSDSPYYGAPQVFYFRPHRKWYLLYQLGLPGRKSLQIAYSTTVDINAPASWSPAQTVFRTDAEDPRPKDGLDYWVICDEQDAYLFYTTLDGRLWRMSTPIGEFPAGFGQPQVALQGDIFEASHTYRLEDTGMYLTIIEANPGGKRYYKAFTADSLDGSWMPLADSRERPFAGELNVHPAGGVAAWADNISHAELVRAGIDETMLIGTERLQLVFQGVLQSEKTGISYPKIPWRIGIMVPMGQAMP